jgi:hypothetical protein
MGATFRVSRLDGPRIIQAMTPLRLALNNPQSIDTDYILDRSRMIAYFSIWLLGKITTAFLGSRCPPASVGFHVEVFALRHHGHSHSLDMDCPDVPLRGETRFNVENHPQLSCILFQKSGTLYMSVNT